MKLSTALVATNRQSDSSGDVPFTASKLVAVVSPQRRPQSEKKVYNMLLKPVIISEWNCLSVSHSAKTFTG